MLSQYKPQRKRSIFSPENREKPFKLSRSRIENFMRCRRCFYLDRKCGTEQPPMFPYTLNNAVDALLKKEFDRYRAAGKNHPRLIEHGLDVIPYSHPDLNDWRINQRGIKYHHKTSNFLVHGAVDDIWVNTQGELIIVDYKATSTTKEVSIDDRLSYKRQMEVYQWLFRQNGFKVSNTGYFFYCNGDAEGDSFTGMLPFKTSIIPYEGSDSWVEGTLNDIQACLMGTTLPELTPTCDYCRYWQAVTKHVTENINRD